MESFKNRLMRFVKSEYQEGQNAFEKRCGLSSGVINKMENGTSTTTLAKIMEVCPQLNLRWLLSGEGEMIEKKVVEKEQTLLPLLPFDAVAGPGEPIYEDERVENYYSVSEFKESDFLIRVNGDSMSPHFTGGDLLACKKVANAFFFQWGRCYVVYTRSQGCMVKRIHPSEKDGFIKCVSDNEKYAPFDVPMDDIVSVALVNGSISME